LADTTDDERLRFEALKISLRSPGGKPLAINPADRKAARTDNRIQIAAQTLILGQQPISAEEPENATPEAQLPMGNESEADQPAAL
jgi:hypothetical protein